MRSSPPFQSRSHPVLPNCGESLFYYCGACRQYEGLNHFSRMEIILTSKDKTRVCIAAFGPTSVRAIELGHPAYSESIEIIPPEALKRQQKSMNLTKGMRASGKEVPEELVFVRDVAYLAKEGQCTFFAERVGGNVAIYSLGSAGYTFH